MYVFNVWHSSQIDTMDIHTWVRLNLITDNLKIVVFPRQSFFLWMIWFQTIITSLSMHPISLLWCSFFSFKNSKTIIDLLNLTKNFWFCVRLFAVIFYICFTSLFGNKYNHSGLQFACSLVQLFFFTNTACQYGNMIYAPGY